MCLLSLMSSLLPCLLASLGLLNVALNFEAALRRSQSVRLISQLIRGRFAHKTRPRHKSTSDFLIVNCKCFLLITMCQDVSTSVLAVHSNSLRHGTMLSSDLCHSRGGHGLCGGGLLEIKGRVVLGSAPKF